MGLLTIDLLLKPKVSHGVQLDLPENMRKYIKIKTLKNKIEMPNHFGSVIYQSIIHIQSYHSIGQKPSKEHAKATPSKGADQNPIRNVEARIIFQKIGLRVVCP